MKEAPLPAIRDTWAITLKVWWAIAWRIIVSLLFGGAAAGIFVKLVPKYFHVKHDAAILYASIAGGIYFLFMTILSVKSILNKRFKGFSVVIIKTH